MMGEGIRTGRQNRYPQTIDSDHADPRAPVDRDRSDSGTRRDIVNGEGV